MRRWAAAVGVFTWLGAFGVPDSAGAEAAASRLDERERTAFDGPGLSSLGLAPLAPMMPRGHTACVTPEAGIAPAAPRGGVRARDALSALLLEQGRDRSPTFAALAAAIERATVHVDVEVAPSSEGPSGRLRFERVEAGVRRLHVRLDPGTTSYGRALSRQIELIAILGHELQHAVEVASSPAVIDAAGFASLYRAIGTSLGDNAFDTAAARAAGDAVLHELRNGGIPSGVARLQLAAIEEPAHECTGAAL